MLGAFYCPGACVHALLNGLGLACSVVISGVLLRPTEEVVVPGIHMLVSLSGILLHGHQLAGLLMPARCPFLGWPEFALFHGYALLNLFIAAQLCRVALLGIDIQGAFKFLAMYTVAVAVCAMVHLDYRGTGGLDEDACSFSKQYWAEHRHTFLLLQASVFPSTLVCMVVSSSVLFSKGPLLIIRPHLNDVTRMHRALKRM